MLTTIIIVAYLAVAVFIQPKIALANHEKAKSDEGRNAANILAFWQSMLWPVMVVLLRGHSAIEDKKSLDEALREARRDAYRNKNSPDPLMAAWDEKAGILSAGKVVPANTVLLFEELTREDLNRRVRTICKHKGVREGVINSIEFKEGTENMKIDNDYAFVKPTTKVTFLD